MTHESTSAAPRSGQAVPRAAIVYNPVKADLVKLQRLIEKVETEAGWDSTRWYESNEEDAGRAATESAVADGADVVMAAGGDGTVRAVAHGLRDSGVPMALVPSGTGNLLARNLELGLGAEAAVRAAFTGVDRKIDLGIAEITREDGSVEEHVFLVMAGLGLDAKMIAKTNVKLKKAVGWLAYVDAGVRALPELEPVRLRYSLNNLPAKALTAHTIIIGNCGSLPGGILLIPEAKPDDGILDIAALRPRGRLGWLRVWNKIAWENGVLRRSAAGRVLIDLTTDVKDVTYLRGRSIRLSVNGPQEFQLDGDEFGTVVAVNCWADAGALTVKVPA